MYAPYIRDRKFSLMKLMKFQSGVFIGPVSTVPIILYGGFFVNSDVMPIYLKVLSYISYIRYSFEGAMLSIYSYGRPKLQCKKDYCHYKPATKILEQMAMENSVYWIDVVCLVSFLLIIRIAAYFVLRLKLRSLR